MKGNIHIFDKRHGSMICTKWLQYYDSRLTLSVVVTSRAKREISVFLLPFFSYGAILSAALKARQVMWTHANCSSAFGGAEARSANRGEKGPSYLRGAHLPRRARWRKEQRILFEEETIGLGVGILRRFDMWIQSAKYFHLIFPSTKICT